MIDVAIASTQITVSEALMGQLDTLLQLARTQQLEIRGFELHSELIGQKAMNSGSNTALIMSLREIIPTSFPRSVTGTRKM